MITYNKDLIHPNNFQMNQLKLNAFLNLLLSPSHYYLCTKWQNLFSILFSRDFGCRDKNDTPTVPSIQKIQTTNNEKSIMNNFHSLLNQLLSYEVPIILEVSPFIIEFFNESSTRFEFCHGITEWRFTDSRTSQLQNHDPFGSRVAISHQKWVKTF